MATVNFTANYIKTTNIKKYDNKTYTPCEANFVELTREDINSINKTAKSWDCHLSDRFASFLKDKDETNKNMHFYALTTQENGFEKLKSKDVQSLALVREEPSLNLLHLYILQVNPKSMSKKNKNTVLRSMNFIGEKMNIKKMAQEHKRVGTETINCIQEQHKGRIISLCSLDGAKKFYKRLGFVNASSESINTFIRK